MGRNPLTHALEAALGLTSHVVLIVTLQIERIDMGRDPLDEEDGDWIIANCVLCYVNGHCSGKCIE